MIKNPIVTLSLLIALVPLAACGGVDATTGGTDSGMTSGTDSGPPVHGTGFAGSCAVAGTNPICIDYEGSSYTASSVQSACGTIAGGTYASTRCTGAKAGTCALANANQGPNQEAVASYYPPTTLTAAQGACTLQGGVFTMGTVASCDGLEGVIAHAAVETRVRFASASVPSGSTCTQEIQSRTCTNGSFDTFTGSYAEETCTVEVVCQGTASACSSFAQFACSGQDGCTWQNAGCATTTPGWVYNCANFTNMVNAQVVCDSQPGCYWLSNACQGGVQSCASATMTECATMAAQGAPCAYAAAACTGTANTCASYASMFSCTSQAGCSWQ